MPEFDYVKFINEGFDAQQKYAEKAGELGPKNFAEIDNNYAHLSENDSIRAYRYAKIIEHFGHLIEEAIEARVYVPRRSWKNNEPSYLDNPQLRREFIAELYDILLFHRAICAYAGINGEEFAQVAADKHAYNQVRPDHNVNGEAPACPAPAEELQGICQSANF